MRHTTLPHSFLSLPVPPPPPASGKGSSVQSSGGSFLELPRCRIALQAEGGRFFSCFFVSFPLSSSHPIPVVQKLRFRRAQGYAFCAYPPRILEQFCRCDSEHPPPTPPNTPVICKQAAPRVWRWRLN